MHLLVGGKAGVSQQTPSLVPKEFSSECTKSIGAAKSSPSWGAKGGFLLSVTQKAVQQLGAPPADAGQNACGTPVFTKGGVCVCVCSKRRVGPGTQPPPTPGGCRCKLQLEQPGSGTLFILNKPRPQPQPGIVDSPEAQPTSLGRTKTARMKGAHGS